MTISDPLSRRERQIMDILYRQGRATALEVQQSLSDPPGYSAVRALLRILEEKGHVGHVKEGRGYVYTPIQSKDRAAGHALRQMLSTFFGGSAERMVHTLLAEPDAELSAEELSRIEAMIREAKEAGR